MNLSSSLQASNMLKTNAAAIMSANSKTVSLNHLPPPQPSDAATMHSKGSLCASKAPVFHHMHKADPMETSEFLVAAKECIECGDASEVIDLIGNHEFQGLTKYVGWELIAIIFPFLDNDQLKSHCFRILDIICQVCSPKEVLLGFSEQLQETSSVESLIDCLKFIKKVLLSLTQRRSKFIQSTCNDVSKQFTRFAKRALSSKHVVESYDGTKAVSASEDNGPWAPAGECNEPQLDSNGDSDNDDPAISITQMQDRCSAVLARAIKPELRNPCFCNCPLSLCDLTASEEGSGCHEQGKCMSCNNNASTTARRIMDHVIMLRIPFVGLMEYSLDENFLEDKGEVNYHRGILSRAKAMICYLVFIKDIGSLYYSFVLSVKYLVDLCMTSINELLKRTDDLASSKAIDLAENMMRRLGESELSSKYIEESCSLVFFETLMEIMILRNKEDLRKRALALFYLSLKRYDADGRMLLLRQLLTKTTHPGAFGLLIQCVVKEAYSSNTQSMQRASSFVELLHLSLDVILSKDFDPLFQSDRVLASLNLLRFLLIRAKTNFETDAWNDLLVLANNYAEPLKKSIGIARVNHNALLKEALTVNETDSKYQSNDDSGKDAELLNVDIFNIHQMSMEQKVQQVHVALNTLDMMECLLISSFPAVHKQVTSIDLSLEFARLEEKGKRALLVRSEMMWEGK
eukprot:gene16214-17846_t